MAKVLMLLPARDFDPTEAAISWQVLTRLGHEIVFATPDGRPGRADDIMLTGQGLDLWSLIPGLRRFTLVGRMLGANADARQAYAAMERDPAFLSPMTWDEARNGEVDGLLLPGGHRARGMRDYIESDVLQGIVTRAFAANLPVAAICHGVLLAARSRTSTGRSVLHGRRTTALTWALERKASMLGRLFRMWDPFYYRTYRESAGQPTGYMSVEHEVRRALAAPEDFVDVPPDAPDRGLKVSGLARDGWTDSRPGFVVRDGHYVSARWPGDAHGFARGFADVLAAAAGEAAAREMTTSLPSQSPSSVL